MRLLLRHDEAPLEPSSEDDSDLANEEVLDLVVLPQGVALGNAVDIGEDKEREEDGVPG